MDVVIYLDNQRRAQFKLEFKTDPNGKRRAYLPDGERLDTRVSGNLERAIFVMDAAGNIYVIVNGSLDGKIHHSTVPGGQPVAAAGQIKAVDGVIVYVDNQSGHYEPENRLLMQLIQALEELGILKGTYEVSFETHDPVPPTDLALDPNGQEKLRKGEIFLSEPADNVESNRTTRDTGSGKETGGREVSAAEAYPDVPESFYRVGMLRWNNTPDNDVPDGVMKRTGSRQEFNLFPAIEGARFFARRRYRGNDRTIYELRKQDLVKTAGGREFLERVQRSIDQNFGGSSLLALTYESGDVSGGVSHIGYYSRQLLERAAGIAVPGPSREMQLEDQTALDGTRLTYYPRDNVEQCQADCANNPNCRGFTLIKAGTYNPGDAAMCYLLSAVTGRVSARGHVSGVK